MLVAYNGKGYDLLLLHKEEERVKSNTVFNNTTLASITAGTLDVMEVVDDRRIDYAGITGKPRPFYPSGYPIRKLDKLYEYVFDEKLKAHDAEADTQGMMKLLDELDPTGKMREIHISNSVAPWLVLPKLERLVKAANITVTVGPNMIPNILRRIQDIRGLDELIQQDLSALMPTNNNNAANTTQYPPEPEEYQPPFHIIHICALVLVLAGSFKGAARTQKQKEARFYKPMHESIEGIDQNNPGVYIFPYAESDDAQSGAANFINGTLFRLLQPAMPTAMEDIVRGLLRYNKHARNDMAREGVMAAGKDGDGSFYCKSGGSQDPEWFLSIKTKDVLSPIKSLLNRDCSCTISNQGVGGYFDYRTMFQTYFFLANYWCLTIKRLQFMVICVLLRPLRIVGTHIPIMYTPLVTLARKTLGVILGASNDAHGVGLTADWYYGRFIRMASHNRLPNLFRYNFAGWSMTDSGVGPRFRLYQSNKAFLQGFSRAIAKVLYFNEENEFGLGSDNLRDTSQRESSPDTRAQYQLEYNVKQTAVLLLYGGSFDYGRRSQWLAVLVRYLLYTVSNLEYQDEVRDFLDGLLSYIKKVNPS